MLTWLRDYCIIFLAVSLFICFNLLACPFPNLIAILLMSLAGFSYYGVSMSRGRLLSVQDILNIMLLGCMLLLPAYAVVTGKLPVVLGVKIGWQKPSLNSACSATAK